MSKFANLHMYEKPTHVLKIKQVTCRVLLRLVQPE